MELGLRGASYYVQNLEKQIPLHGYDTDNHYEVYGTHDRGYSIICIGDSFTNGGNRLNNWRENYPYHLSRNLIELGQNVQVKNMGLCEDTTLGVSTRLKERLETLKDSFEIPRYVVVLAGSADAFHLKSEETHDKLTWINPESKAVSLDKSWYYKLRIYKVFRYIRFQMKHWYLLRFTESKDIQHMWDKAGDYGKEIEKGNYHKANIILEEGIEYVAKKVPPSTRLGDQFILYRELIDSLIVTITNSNLTNNDYDRAFESLLKIVKAMPEAWGVYGLRYLVYQTFLKQSNYSSFEVAKLIEQNQEILKRPKVREFYENILKLVEGEEGIDRVRMELWTQMVNLSKKYNFTLIMQNYPSGYTAVNRALSKISSALNLPLVDNATVFDRLIQRDGRSKYLRGDDHCTDLGYQIMAQNVTRILSQLENKKAP